MRGIDRLTVDIHQSDARTRDYIDSKLDAQLDDIRHVWANYKSSSSSSSSRRRCSNRKSSEWPKDASTTRHRQEKLHEHKRRPCNEHQQDGATATTTTSASLPSVIKASSPLDARHLRLPPTSTPTSAFIHDDGDEMIEHGIFP